MTDNRTLVIGTRNRKKLAEIQRLLDGLPVVLNTLDDYPEAGDVEETGKTFKNNAVLKAAETAAAIGEWTVADDSGLEVDALGGRPGVYSARYAGPEQVDENNMAKVLKELRDVEMERRTARFKCAIALAAPDRLLFVVEESCEGRIALGPRGTSGFGYDPVFVPDGYGRSFAELGSEIKDRLSHRGKALRRFREELKKLLQQDNDHGR
ncbi:MAG: XTP/dITP diphosphatase [Planctomycetes bacterium]|nr:XTP/dITP diphosphatase [Planctomycetota bacterium]